MRVLVVEDIHRHTTLRAAGIELDQLTGTITREGRIIKLTAKERLVPKVGPAPLSIATAHASRAACHHPWGSASDARLGRQVISERPDPPQLTFVLDETVLHRQIGSPVTMAEQLVLQG